MAVDPEALDAIRRLVEDEPENAAPAVASRRVVVLGGTHQ